MISNIAAVVVHHRSYHSVAGVVENLISQGLSVHNIVIIDNSEEPDKSEGLRQSLPPSAVALFVENRGYAAAVNAGFDYFCSRGGNLPDFLLVSTHETRPEQGAVAALMNALNEDPDSAVAGPTLVSGNSPEFVWSTGGYLAPITHIPSHYDHRAPLEVLPDKAAAVSRGWLDGAFLLYRWKDFGENRVPERYFLYMEETELHLNFVKAGRKVLWVPEARAWQDSSGIPPYYLARNLRILFQAHENSLRRLTVIPYAVAKRVLSDIIRRRDFSSLAPSLRGLLAPLPREERPHRKGSIEILNPLAAALRHYESEVSSVLSQDGHNVTATRIMEPSAAGHSPAKWVFDYVKTLIRTKATKQKSGARLLVLWPVLGYWDIVLFKILRVSQATLVMHDPHPLVKAVGYSDLAKKCASIVRGDVRILAHSQKALDAITMMVPDIPAEVLPHPILEPRKVASTRPETKPIVRVLGQYKPDRDIHALVEIGRALGGSAVLEVHGRGWPEIEGWDVVPGFVTEERLDALMAESSAVIIPYKNFFQSGIAIRALELGVPFVGPRASVLSEMMGKESCLLVDEDSGHSWVDAVRYAIDEGAADAETAGQRWRRHNITTWRSWSQEAR